MRLTWVRVVAAAAAMAVLLPAMPRAHAEQHAEQASGRLVFGPPAPTVARSGVRPGVARSGDPTTRLIASDPLHAPTAISDAVIAATDATPAGETIDITTYWISSPRIEQAIHRAVARGVVVHAIFAGNDHARSFPATRRLVPFLNRPELGASWAKWAQGAARGNAGIMHQKSYRFSRVGEEPWVVINGSYNSAASSDRGSYAFAWQVAGDQALYDAFGTIGAEQAAGRTLRRPLRRFGGADWSAYFLPATALNPRTDPVMQRLRAITAGPGTSIRIEMYSMWGPRADWIVRRLAEMRRRGARIAFVAGPAVVVRVQHDLARAGVIVRSGCFADRSYTHAKDMSATWVEGGVRRYWTWVGSDNWTPLGVVSDEAVLGIEGKAGYDVFNRAYTSLVARRDAVPPSRCHPHPD